MKETTAKGSNMRGNQKIKRAECNEEGKERGKCNGQLPY